MISRKEAKMIAEELYNFIRKDAVKATEEILKDETEEFIGLKDAAQMLGMSPSTLYKNKDKFGCYSKMNGRIRFAKSRLKKVVIAGIN